MTRSVLSSVGTTQVNNKHVTIRKLSFLKKAFEIFTPTLCVLCVIATPLGLIYVKKNDDSLKGQAKMEKFARNYHIEDTITPQEAVVAVMSPTISFDP